MQVKSLIRREYPVVTPHEATASVESTLLDRGFAVVKDEDGYRGILSSDDVLNAPRFLVIDCLRERPRVDEDADAEEVLRVMREARVTVVPVFRGSRFLGVCARADIAAGLAEHAKGLQREVVRFVSELVLTSRSLAQESEWRGKLQRERVHLLTAIQQLDEAIVVADAQGAVEYVNAAFERITGYPPPNASDRTLRLWELYDRDSEAFRALFGAVSRGESWHGRIRGVGKGNRHYEEETVVSPVLGFDGKPSRFVAIKRDVTERVEFERLARQSEKFQAIGTLAGGVAHDFNNVLSAILGHAELILHAPGDAERVAHHGREILRAGESARELIGQILTYSRPAKPAPQPVEVNRVVADAAKLLQASLPSRIHLRLELDSRARVMGDPVQLGRVVLNLATNALHAIGPGPGVIRIGVRDADPDRDPSLARRGREGVRYVVLSVEDTGVGISPDVLERIFDPFFTTKGPEEGTGMGLAVVQGIAQGHGGFAEVRSEMGQGAQFSVYLPLLLGVPEAACPPEVPAEDSGTSALGTG